MFNVNCYANITVQEICTVFIDIRVLPLNGPKKPLRYNIKFNYTVHTTVYNNDIYYLYINILLIPS